MRRETRSILLLALLLTIALAAPLADAKGGGGGGAGRRSSCYPQDTDRDGVISDQERSDQCGSSPVWPLLAIGGGMAAIGAFSVKNRLAHRLNVGDKGTLDERRPFTVVARLDYRNPEGDRWKEYLLRFDDGGKEAWLEIDGGEVTLHRETRRQGSITPPTVDGKRVEVEEADAMSLEGTLGPLPAEERSRHVRYVDGKLADGQKVSIEQDETGVVVYESFPANLRSKGRLSLQGPLARRW